MVVPLVVRERTAWAVQGSFGWTVADMPRELHPDVARSADAVWGLIEGYTRGRGIPPLDDVPAPYDLAQVAFTATARLAMDPAQRESMADETPEGTRSRRGGFHGWTLAERAVLDRYRRRAL